MRMLTLLFTACLAAACVRTATNPATGEVDIDVESPTQRGEDWDGTITGRGIYSRISGSTRALVAEGQTTVTISLTGLTPGGRHPWHVHEGACASGGPIVGGISAYGPLVVGADGTAQGSARLALQLNEALDYHVNVHASPTDLATIIACGDLDD